MEPGALSGPILVTGGTGFLGGRLVERLLVEHGAEVRVLVRNYGKAMRVARFDAVRLMPGDYADARAVAAAAEGCGTIFNCAHSMGGSFPRQNMRSNVQGTRNVIDAAVRTGARLVHVGSVDAYGLPNVDVVHEGLPLAARGSAYPEGKRRTEEEIWARYRQRAFPVSVVQPTVIYGPFAGWTIGSSNGLRNCRIALVDGGRGICNPVYVDDVIDAMLLAATVPEAVGRRFLISGPDSPTWGEWYGRHEQTLGVRSTVPMEADELERAMADERRRGKLVPAARAAFGHPGLGEAVDRLKQARVVEAATKGPIRIVGDLLFLVPGLGDWEDRARAMLRRRRARHARAAAGPPEDPRPLILPPDPWTVRLFGSRSRVSIDLARDVLGYGPRYDFEAGMQVTDEFLRWARL